MIKMQTLRPNSQKLARIGTEIARSRIARVAIGALLILAIGSGHTPREENTKPVQSLTRPLSHPVLIDTSEEMIRARLFEPLKTLRIATFTGTLSNREEANTLKKIAKAVKEIETATNGDSLARTVVRQNITPEQFAELSRLLE